MPVPDALLNQIKCCLSNDGHILIDPVVLKCKGNACKECLSDSKEEAIHCYSCNGKHQKKDLINAIENTVAKTLVDNFMGDLFEYTENRIKSISENLTSRNP